MKIHMILKEPEESKARRNSELRVEQEVRAIQEQVSSGGAENMPEEHAEPEKAKPEEKKKTEKKRQAKSKRRFLERAFQKERISGETGRIFQGRRL